MTEYLLSRSSVGAYPDSLAAVLDEIDRRGGIDAALRGAGVTDADLAVLRGACSRPEERASRRRERQRHARGPADGLAIGTVGTV
jgi:hypothetical protein